MFISSFFHAVLFLFLILLILSLLYLYFIFLFYRFSSFFSGGGETGRAQLTASSPMAQTSKRDLEGDTGWPRQTGTGGFSPVPVMCCRRLNRLRAAEWR
jgi:hypothetical protein